MTVAILPGVFSGPHTSKRLRDALVKAGHTITESAETADCIIAHSAGCLRLPPARDDQLIVFVDPPYWPGKTMWQRGGARTKRNFVFYRYKYPFWSWLSRNLWGVYYGIRRLNFTRLVFTKTPSYDLIADLHGRNAVLVRNKYDDWLTPKFTTIREAYPKLPILTMPGDHDDINYHPQRYVDLLQSEERRRHL